MTLCDAGPLVAIIDRDDANHARCAAAASQLPPQGLVTTWACFTEAMYLVYRAGGYPMQDHLWRLRRQGVLTILATSSEEADRMEMLMREYRDAPMDLADASLVAAAESQGIRQVFTIDSHFRAYRIGGNESFNVVP